MRPSAFLASCMALLLARPSVQQDTTYECIYYQVPVYECILCPYILKTQNPNHNCHPFNATFDDIPAGQPTGEYDTINWTNFQTVAGNASQTKLHPYSLPNYARLPAGDCGELVPSGLGGQIYSLHYGCTRAGKKAPAACNVTVTGYCGDAESQNQIYHSTTLSYGAPNTGNGTLAFVTGFPIFGQDLYCTNFSVTAAGSKGKPVDLYLDDVVFSDYY